MELGSGTLTVSGNNTAYITTSIGPYAIFPSLALPFTPYTPPNLGPETPERWLRRRISEVCEMAA